MSRHSRYLPFSSDEVRMWLSLAFVSLLAFILCWSLRGFQVASFYMLPVWSTLLIFGPFFSAFRYPCMTLGASAAFLFVSAWWMRSYPAECRIRWKDKLLFDSDWTLQSLGVALKLYRHKLLPGVSHRELRHWLEEHHMIGNQSSSGDSTEMCNASSSEADRGAHRGPKSLQTGTLLRAGARRLAHESGRQESEEESESESESEKQLEPSELLVHKPSVDDVQDFDLRAYCMCHQEDSHYNFPSVYIFFEPPAIWGPYVEHILHGRCYPWTCTFTERHANQFWAFLGTLIAAVFLNVLHWRGCGQCTNYWLGTGQVRLWWIWFWAMFIPVWSVMLITRVKGCSFEEFTTLLWTEGFRFLASTQNLLVISIVGLGMTLVYMRRKMLYKMLGIDDHYVVHWFNFTNPPQAQQTIQLCIWRLDVNGSRAMADFAQWEAMGPREVHSQTMRGNFAGNERSQSLFRLSCGKRYEQVNTFFEPWPMEETSNLTFPGGHPPNLFFRIAYGHNEIQNSRVQRMSKTLFEDDVVQVRENFRLTTDGMPESTLFVEVNDQGLISYTVCGKVSISEANVMRECRRSHVFESLMEETMRCQLPGGIAFAQVNKMLESHSPHHYPDENMDEERKQMYLSGFKPHELSDGGVVWLAFATVPNEEVASTCTAM